MLPNGHFPSDAPSTGLHGHLLGEPPQQWLAVGVSLLQHKQHCLGVDVRVVSMARQLLGRSHDSHMINSTWTHIGHMTVT